MSKLLKTVLISVLVFTLFTVTAFAETATVTGSDVNVRTGPDLSYTVIDCLPKGAVVTVYDRSNSSWYGIEYDDVRGFMSSRYLSVQAEEVEEYEDEETGDIVVFEESEEANGYIDGMYVRFRSGPSTSSSILGEFNRGKALTITGTAGDWTACIINGNSGYVFSQYVTKGSYSYGGEEPDEEEEEEEYIAPEPQTEPEDEGEEVDDTPQAEEPDTSIVVDPVSETTGHINGDYVRFRTGPSTSYSIIDNYNRGKQLTVTGVSGEWTACVIDGESGYVFSQYVTIDSSSNEPEEEEEEEETPVSTPAPTVVSSDNRNGYIKGNTVRFRAGPSLNDKILGEYYYGNPLTITGTSGDWTAVIINGVSGYVYSDYVGEGSFSTGGSNSGSSSSGSNSDLGEQIANFALQFVGCRYVWGGTSPDGFDCSGLVYYTYKNFGYILNRTASDQAANGVHVDGSNLQPGDILCFYSGGSYIGHSGIYIGDGKFVHACNSSTGVIISELSGYYSSRGFEARRIV